MTGWDFEELYRLLSVPMIDFDCGKLCAPTNGGVPVCCDAKKTMPILYRDEYEWHRPRKFWKKKVCRCLESRKLSSALSDIYVLGHCPGPAACDRDKRALVCRLFPLEPVLNPDGTMLGLTFNDEEGHTCPLMRQGLGVFRSEYIRNAMTVWERILEAYPEERELYIQNRRNWRVA